jgi:hypothetical protein
MPALTTHLYTPIAKRASGKTTALVLGIPLAFLGFFFLIIFFVALKRHLRR